MVFVVSSLRRAAITPAARNSIARLAPRCQRYYSMACANSVVKLHDILEEYRAEKQVLMYRI
eukprot:CAMPEP_0183705528 /NCGR_PEP_ID=MMETSP0737-20130205/2574_1 /TAXON_ID=385413 /ORGANISM="Thalassiosira miniscula, Strain CCMP1093" /LENGTH=61 /DNA_ID=CAMNT_0025932677 /DNA_START=129 /DNA_END=314 /DNA_ORIENTATION=+